MRQWLSTGYSGEREVGVKPLWVTLTGQSWRIKRRRTWRRRRQRYACRRRIVNGATTQGQRERYVIAVRRWDRLRWSTYDPRPIVRPPADGGRAVVWVGRRRLDGRTVEDGGQRRTGWRVGRMGRWRRGVDGDDRRWRAVARQAGVQLRQRVARVGQRQHRRTDVVTRRAAARIGVVQRRPRRLARIIDILVLIITRCQVDSFRNDHRGLYSSP